MICSTWIVYTCSEWDASEEPSDCSVELRVSRPNWLCAEREEVLKKLYVPLTQLDTEGMLTCMSSPDVTNFHSVSH